MAERIIKAMEGRWDELSQRHRYMVVEIGAQSVAAFEHSSFICGVKYEKKSRRLDRARSNNEHLRFGPQCVTIYIPCSHRFQITCLSVQFEFRDSCVQPNFRINIFM